MWNLVRKNLYIDFSEVSEYINEIIFEKFNKWQKVNTFESERVNQK